MLCKVLVDSGHGPASFYRKSVIRIDVELEMMGYKQ